MRPHNILDSWNISLDNIPILDNDDVELSEVRLNEASRWVDVVGAFSGDCTIFLDTSAPIPARKTVISRLGPNRPCENVQIVLLKNHSDPQIKVGGHNNKIFIGRFGYAFYSEICIWNNSNFVVGDHSTCNQARIVLDNSDIIIGRDCMLSDNILLQSNDQHGIVSLPDKKIINSGRSQIHLGEHVWVGRRSIVMPDVKIGRGSVIGSGAVVTRDVGEFSICVGVPAKVVRENCSWSRSQALINNQEMTFFDAAALPET
ncbi:acyltransferase [Acidisoma cellulosilytica]|uniref:Acyltransferase n=1 Tax=Acidisoma cellulosilyticum TaxID=2802395 RepID=A0A963Z185_9PROT|nr:acyltransferase [Acidisoma cellulosilyticum]MCB8879995.1 acyltransferase [Acidisoma cellulosilyticum]